METHKDWKHREDFRRQVVESRNFNTEGCQSLCVAVVERAVKDYRAALRRHYRKPHDQEAQHTIDECERFFKWDMGLYSDLDGESIIRAVRERVREEMRRG